MNYKELEISKAGVADSFLFQWKRKTTKPHLQNTFQNEEFNIDDYPELSWHIKNLCEGNNIVYVAKALKYIDDSFKSEQIPNYDIISYSFPFIESLLNVLTNSIYDQYICTERKFAILILSKFAHMTQNSSSLIFQKDLILIVFEYAFKEDPLFKENSLLFIQNVFTNKYYDDLAFIDLISETPFLNQYIDLYPKLANFKEIQIYFDNLCVIIAKIRKSKCEWPPAFINIIDFLYKIPLDKYFGIDLEEYLQTLIILYDYTIVRKTLEKDRVVEIIKEIFSNLANFKYLRFAFILITKVYENGFLDDFLFSDDALNRIATFLYSCNEDEADALIGYFNLLLHFNKDFYIEKIIPLLMNYFKDKGMQTRKQFLMHIMEISKDQDIINILISNFEDQWDTFIKELMDTIFVVDEDEAIYILKNLIDCYIKFPQPFQELFDEMDFVESIVEFQNETESENIAAACGAFLDTIGYHPDE